MSLTSQGGIEDCISITKAFERGANASMTEESVFAVLTPRLQTMRNLAANTKRDMAAKAESTKRNSVPQEDDSIDTQDPALLKLFQGNPKGTREFLIECLPCSPRINFKKDLDVKSLIDANFDTSSTSAWIVSSSEFLKRCIRELQDIINLFKSKEHYVDLCAFRKLFLEFVCIPDIHRIMALLSVYLMKLALQLNSIFGLIISFFAPLLLPFLTGIVDMLTKFILACIQPIECVIRAFQEMLYKLDHNVIFQNTQIAQLDIFGGISLNPFGSQAYQQAEANEVGSKRQELQELQEASRNINPSNREAVQRNIDQVSAAKANLARAEAQRELSAISRANQRIGRLRESGTSFIYRGIRILRQAAETIRSYINQFMSDLTRLMQDWLGTGATTISILGDKLRVVQFMSMIAAILNTIKNPPDCDDDSQQVQIIDQDLTKNSSFSIWTDEDGVTHIEDKDTDIKPAIDELVKTFGLVPREPSDFGNDSTRQKFNSLLKSTGDSVLDSSISKSLDSLLTPSKVSFKCPLKTSVASAEQVNEWIKQLDSEF